MSYYVMDGSALYDTDAALVIVVCNTWKEACDYINDYGADTCIVDAETWKLKWCLLWGQPPEVMI